MYDAVVIGGGVVGCAILRELCCHEGRFIMIESSQIASGASSGNSGIWHCGFDCSSKAPLERQLILRSNELARHVFPSLFLAHPPPGAGALLVAWSPEEHSQFADLASKAAANQCTVHQLSANQLYEREPALQPGALGAIHIPGERVIDSYNLVHAYAAHARANGGVIRENCHAVDGVIQGDSQRHWRVNVREADGRCDSICARVIINAAGLHGDNVELAFLNRVSFEIKPRKGEFLVLDGIDLEVPLKHIILPFPSERTKGVLLTPTLSSHLLIGPTAIDVSERLPREAQCDGSTAQHLFSFAREKLKVLGRASVVTTYAGLRPATEHQDYVIEAHIDQCWVTVAGIRSTGVSASLGIAEHVAQQLHRIIGPLHPKASMQPPQVPSSGCYYQSVDTPLHPLAKLRRASAKL